MMPNITRGDRMGGLLVYLVGPGRANEHTNPHLVAADDSVAPWLEVDELNRHDALEIARRVDHPRRTFGVEVPKGSVWHCSLSLRDDEGQLPDEKWAAIAREFADEMGFTERDRRAACRWVAVRHGLSKAGNDHIHIVVSLVREDSTKASVWNDQPNAQRVAGQLERKHGLRVLESRAAGRGSRGVKPAEHAIAARRGAPEPARFTLARTVRACAAAAADEAEFVRRARRAGLLIRPRYAKGRTDVVVGYSVTQRPGRGQRPIWFGGGRLARDLTLPRLRAEWPDTPQHAAAAAAEWNAAKHHRRVVAPGREGTVPDPALWERHTAEVAALRERLRAVPVDDAATWAQVAKETSGAFAAWSARVERQPGPLADTADALARSAQLRAHAVRGRRAPGPSVKGAALLLASIARGGRGAVAEAVLLRQLANTIKALHDAHRAVGEARRAEEIARVVRTELVQVSAALRAEQPAAASRPGGREPEAAGPAAGHGSPPTQSPGEAGAARPRHASGRPASTPSRDSDVGR